MAEAPRDYEAELRAIMDALAESVAEEPDEDVLGEAREEGEDPRVTAHRVRGILKRAANNDGRRSLRAPYTESTNQLAFQAESDMVAALELAFANKSLRELCESEAQADRHLGPTIAQKLRRRLSDLRAARNVKDLVAGRPRELAGGRRGCVGVQLSSESRLVFCANHTVLPVLETGDVDWSKVSRVKILSIGSDDA
jgi:proteic killer suppression protein